MKKKFKNEVVDWLWGVFAVAFIALVGTGVL